MAKKTYILDTNVLLHDPECLWKFEDNDIVIPITVLEELDKFKKIMDEKGRNARFINRKLDEMRPNGSLNEGVSLPHGGTIRVDTRVSTLDGFDPAVNDHKIMACAVRTKAILVTKDINLRVKADSIGLRAEDYENDKVDSSEELYSGFGELIVPEEFLNSAALNPHPASEGFLENQFVQLTNMSNPKHTLLTRIVEGHYCKIENVIPAGNISPRNREQQLALNLLTDTDLSLVTLVGKAGCGKTLLALAAGLDQVDNNLYRRMLVSRPVVPMGRDIGYLPGDANEKMAPWMLAFKDNFEQIVNYGEGDDDIDEKKPGRRKPAKKGEGPKLSAMDELQIQGIVEVSVLTYLRGRSIPKQFMVVDEAQNLSPHELKTIITRAGEGTKIILTGDVWQVDTPYLDAYSNGLSYVVDKFKGQPMYGHIHLTKGERSELAERAADLL